MFGNWGTAAVTVQWSSLPSSIIFFFLKLPCSFSCKCVLCPAFPISYIVRNRRGGQPCRCTSWTVCPLSLLHAPGFCAHRAMLKAQRHGYSSESAPCLPCRATLIAHCVPLLTDGTSPAPNTTNSTFLCLSWYNSICYLILAKKNIFLSRCPEPPRKCLLFSVCRSLLIYQASLVTHHLLMLMLGDRATECKSGKAVMLQLGKSGASLSKYWQVCKQTEGSFQQAALWLPELMLDQRHLVLCGYELLFTEGRIQEWISSSCDDSGKLMGSQEPPAACPLPTCNTRSGCNHFSPWKNKLSFSFPSSFQMGFLQEDIQDNLHWK